MWERVQQPLLEVPVSATIPRLLKSLVVSKSTGKRRMCSPNLAIFPQFKKAESSKLRSFPAPPFFLLALSLDNITTSTPSVQQAGLAIHICTSETRHRDAQSLICDALRALTEVSLRVVAARLARQTSAPYIINCKTFRSLPAMSSITSKHWISPQTTAHAFQPRLLHSRYRHKYQSG